MVDLNVRGVGVRIDAHSELLETLRHDFFYFLSAPREGAFRIRLHNLAAARFRKIPYLKIKRTLLYVAPPGERRLRLFEKAYVRYAFRKGWAEIYCDDPTLAYEICYLLILSYVGERLDEKGLHRIHGLGLSKEQAGFLFLAASGTGKSTLALRLLGNPAHHILSDDTPLVDAKGQLLAFPQRIGLREKPSLPSEWVRSFHRAEYGEKQVVSSEFFAKQIQSESPLSWVVLLGREKREDVSIEPARMRELILPLLRWLVIGHETPQIWQFYLRLSPRDWVKKAGILMSRCRVAIAILRTAQIRRITLSSDRIASALAVGQWMGSPA